MISHGYLEPCLAGEATVAYLVIELCVVGKSEFTGSLCVVGLASYVTYKQTSIHIITCSYVLVHC